MSPPHRPGHPHDRLHHCAWAGPLPAVLFCSQCWSVCVDVSSGQRLPQPGAGPSLRGCLSPMLTSDVVVLYLLPPCISIPLPSPPSRRCYGNQAVVPTASLMDRFQGHLCVYVCVSLCAQMCVCVALGFHNQDQKALRGEAIIRNHILEVFQHPHQVGLCHRHLPFPCGNPLLGCHHPDLVDISLVTAVQQNRRSSLDPAPATLAAVTRLSPPF